MSASSETSVEPAVPDGVGVATPNEGADDGPPDAAPPGSSGGAADDALPRPKYLDPNWIKEGVPETQFYKEYPPDPWGQEAAPNARVWKIYRDEMTRTDTETLESWNGTLDVLLIFAGLFSAVSTAFIIESYKALQPDYTQYMANFLYEAAGSNLAVGGVLTLPNARSMGPPDRFVSPSATQRWTNGLWFTSLAMSLIVALLCIMIKQWLDQYRARMKRSVPSLQGWARRHQIYHPGLSRWGVPTLISLLPLFLHVSLFLFFVGLVLFLRPLDGAIAFTLLAMLILTLIFYVLSLATPALYIDCPSYTPLLEQARSLITIGLGLLANLCSVLTAHIPHRRRFLMLPIGRATAHLRRTTEYAHFVLRRLRIRSEQRFGRETSIIGSQKFILDGQALGTLLVSTNDPDVIDAGVEAVGAISAEPTLQYLVREGRYAMIDDRSVHDFLNTGATSSAFAVMTDARRVRTHWTLTMTARDDTGSEPSLALADLYPFLGLEGTMIQLMAVHRFSDAEVPELRLDEVVASFRRRLYAHVCNMIPRASGQTRRLLPRTQSISGLNRATCLLFLHMASRANGYLGHRQRHRSSCLLLTFCAGDFATAEQHEQVLAAQSLLAELGGGYAVEAPTGAVPTRNAADVLCNTLDRVFGLLATDEELLAGQETARPFIHHLGLLFRPSAREIWRLEQLAGFTAFILSSNFVQCVSQGGLGAYADALREASWFGSNNPESSQQYYTSVATVLKLGLDFGEPHIGLLVDIESFLASPKEMISVFGRASDTIMLSRFRQCTSWITAEAYPDLANNDIRIYAEGISCLLCYRQRHHPVDAALVDWLFFRRFLANQICGTMGWFRKDGVDKRLWQRRLATMAKHCARLSLDGMLRVCDVLENSYNDKDALGEEVLAFVAETRRGLQPGGELLGECDPSCDCWPKPEPQPPAEPTARTTRWRKRILGRIAGAPDSAA